MTEQEVLDNVILGYRQLLTERYQYANIQAKYDLPSYFDEPLLIAFRDFFLEHVYPNPAQRKELDAAFQNLDNYIKQPEKLVRLLLDSTSLLFKYGRHLPKILRAGMKALKSFRTATQFEKELVRRAIAMPLSPPYTPENIRTLIGTLSTKDIDQFIENNKALFGTMKDRVLVQKIIEIVEHLIAKMRKRPNIYSNEEIKGVEIGRDIIKGGNDLFAKLSKREQEEVLDFAIRIETDAIKEIFV